MVILNEKIVFLVLYMAANALRIYAVSRYMKSFFGKIIKPLPLAMILYLVYFLANSFGFILFRSLSVNILSNFLLCFLVSCVYRASLERKLLVTVLINAINIGWDSLIGAAFFPTDFLPVTTGATTSICVLLTWYAFDRYLSLRDFSFVSLRGSSRVMLAIPVATISLASLNYFLRFHDPLTVVNLLGLLFIDIMIIRIYEYLLQLQFGWYSERLSNEQNQSRQYQYDVLQESITRIQRLQHDMKNHTQSLAAILQDGRVEDAVSYLNEMSDFIKTEKEVVSTGNADVDSILNYKLARALEGDIHIKTLVSIPETLPVKPFDLNVILSNLLDNAIDAAEKCKEKRIRIVIRTEMNMLYVAVENTYLDEPVRIRDRFMTLKEDKCGHGFGIQNVRSVVKNMMGRYRSITKMEYFMPPCLSQWWMTSFNIKRTSFDIPYCSYLKR